MIQRYSSLNNCLISNCQINNHIAFRSSRTILGTLTLTHLILVRWQPPRASPSCFPRLPEEAIAIAITTKNWQKQPETRQTSTSRIDLHDTTMRCGTSMSGDKFRIKLESQRQTNLRPATLEVKRLYQASYVELTARGELPIVAFTIKSELSIRSQRYSCSSQGQ